MHGFLRRNLTTVLVAMVTAAVTAGGPAIAATIADYAKNADRVDGKHAVGAGASRAEREGKLVATSPTTGRLPDDIIAKAPDAQELDGLDSRAFQRRLKRTIVVSPVGTEAQNGEALRAALASIPLTGPNQPVPRSSWLIHLEPGAYVLTSQLQMRDWVDIQGSGRDTTIVQCDCPSGILGGGGLIRGADGTTLRSLSVVNIATTGDAVAYTLGGYKSARLDDVVLAASAPEGYRAAGIVTTSESSAWLTNSTVSGGSPTWAYSYGAWAWDNSRVSLVNASANGHYGLAKEEAARIRAANSMISGEIFGNVTCVGAYDPQFSALTTNCMP